MHTYMDTLFFISGGVVQTQKKGGKRKGKQHNRYVSGSSHGVVPCPFPLSSSPLLLSLHNVRDGPAQVPPRVCTRLKTVSATHRPFLLDVFLYFLHVHAHTSAHLTCEEEEKKKISTPYTHYSSPLYKGLHVHSLLFAGTALHRFPSPLCASTALRRKEGKKNSNRRPS
jgi:hypothetical protein